MPIRPPRRSRSKSSCISSDENILKNSIKSNFLFNLYYQTLTIIGFTFL